MLLGKRPRPPMKRTTSLSEITFDLKITSTSSDDAAAAHNNQLMMAAPFGNDYLQRFSATNSNNNPSPRPHRRASANFLETAKFLRSCSLCKRRLVPSRDIYMYRGDSAFCSLECRQQQMNQDERKEKCSIASKKEVSTSSSTAASKVAAKGETTVAAVYT